VSAIEIGSQPFQLRVLERIRLARQRDHAPIARIIQQPPQAAPPDQAGGTGDDCDARNDLCHKLGLSIVCRLPAGGRRLDRRPT